MAKAHLDRSACDGSKDIAVVLIRGLVNTTTPVRDTLKMLHLERKNYCAVVKNTPQNIGMLMKVKDMIAFGEIDAETKKLLEDKRGEKDAKGLKKFFRLAPPKGGFERKGIKKPFNLGGALGYRGEHMSDLIKRMI